MTHLLAQMPNMVLLDGQPVGLELPTDSYFMLPTINNIVMVFITFLELIVFGLLTTLLKYWTGYIKLIRPQELENLIVTILLHYIRIYHTMP